MAPVHVEIDELYNYNLTVHGMTLVQGRDAAPLTLDTLAVPPTLTFPNSTVAFNPPAGDDGRIGAALRNLTTTLPTVRQNLDTLVETVVTRVNGLHTTGFGLDGGTGRTFFDPAGLAAGTFALSADMTDPRFIAASDDADPTAVGDNDIATAILNERTVLQAGLNNQTVENHAISIVTGIGSRLQTVNGQYEGQAAVVNYLDALERGVSGVSANEELTNLIQYQQSFGAAARVLSTVQTMMDTLLAL
jgi:flagellar hook-associated protein 1 FlgK